MKRKILSIIVITLFISAVLTSFIAQQFISDTYEKSMKSKLISNLNLIVDTMKILDTQDQELNYFNLAQKLSIRIDERITFFDDQGRAIADSKDNSVILDPPKLTSEIKQAKSGRFGIEKRINTKTGETSLYIASPSVQIRDHLIIVRLEASMTPLERSSFNFMRAMLTGILMGLCLALGIGLSQVNLLVRPILHLTEATKSITEGSFEKFVIEKTNDEIEDLSHHFEMMRQRLQVTTAQINEKNMHLNNILNSTVNGLIAIDNNDNIIMFNEKAREILNIQNVNTFQKETANTWLNDEIFSILKNVKEYKNYQENEIKQDDKILKLYATPILNSEKEQQSYGGLVIIQDVTKLRKLEALRIEFVSNVSHELRTPLTSISGFIETLKDFENLTITEISKILNIIELESERLNRLINDLLTLSEIESIQLKPKQVIIDVKQEIIHVLTLFEKQIKDKGINIKFDAICECSYIMGNPDWFKRLLINLLDNAIKYSFDNGQIEINLQINNENLIVSISDKGIGIASENISRLTERFYRVDKGRARKRGGTGLGLSIVKHIVEQMNGTMKIESKQGEGTRVMVSFQVVNDN